MAYLDQTLRFASNTAAPNEHTIDRKGMPLIHYATDGSKGNFYIGYEDGTDKRIWVGALIDDNADLGSSDDKLATQNAIQTYVDAAVATGDTTLTDGKLWVGNGSGAKAEVSITGDASISNSGVWTNTGAAGNFAVAGDLTVTGKTVTDNVEVISTTTGVQFEGTTADGNDAILKSAVSGAPVTYTMPNVTGHIGLFTASTGTDTIAATVTEINKLDGFTGDATDLNYAEALYDTGVTAAEFGRLDGVTEDVTTSLSGISTSLAGKQATLTFGKSSGNALKTEEDLTANDVMVMGSSNVKGRTYTEIKSDLSLNNVANETRATILGGNHTGTVNSIAAATVTSGAALGATANQDTTSAIRAGTTASNVGLGNVDNTTDAGKPVSTATQTALDAKQDDLTFGKVSGNTLKSEEALTTNDVLLMGATNVKGRTYAEVKTDLSLNNVDNDSTSTIRAGTTKANVGLSNVANETRATILGGNLTGTVNNVAAATVTSGAALGATANQATTATILGGNHTGTVNSVAAATVTSGAALGATSNQDTTAAIRSGVTKADVGLSNVENVAISTAGWDGGSYNIAA